MAHRGSLAHFFPCPVGNRVGMLPNGGEPHDEAFARVLLAFIYLAFALLAFVVFSSSFEFHIARSVFPLLGCCFTLASIAARVSDSICSRKSDPILVNLCARLEAQNIA